jgi:hypothetical protein
MEAPEALDPLSEPESGDLAGDLAEISTEIS